MPMSRALWWAALSGFLALAWEIVWSRVFNFASGSRAPVFGLMLASYLLGLAIGSLWSQRWQRGHDTKQLGRLIFASNAVAFLVAPCTALLAPNLGWQWGYALVGLSGVLLGVLFPWLCHAAVSDKEERAGQQLSWLYLANIIGSGTGSLLTGFVLMDLLSLHLLSVLLLVIAFVWVSTMGARPWAMLLLTLGLTALPFISLYERLQYKADYNGTMRFPTIVESKHGVITVDSNHRVYGNGAYDGVIETQLEPGSWLVRPYFLSAVREELDDVLVIGVASGAWTQILAHHPHVKRITAIELSEGYLHIIAQQPAVKSLLTNPKVEIVIDDGRRWLRRHPERRFDAIVMNTTHHWREFASALLSVEFLSQVKAHLKPQGIAYWNCTDSIRAARTGMEVFPHTMMVMNHCLASNAPLQPNRTRWESVLQSYAIDGQPLFAGQSQALAGVLDFVDRHEPKDAPWRWMDRAQMQAWCGDAKLITDDNLGDEY